MDAALDGVSILVPVVGPIVSSIVRQVAPRDEQIYLAAFANEVASRIIELDEGKVDRSYFASADWLDDVGRARDALAQRRHRSKRKHYVAALVNGASTDRPDEVERHRFLDLLEAVRPSHLRLLAVIVASEHQRDGGTFDDYVRHHMPDQDVENIRLDWADLNRAGVVEGIPGGMANSAMSERIWGSFNAFGRRFASFVEVPAEADEEAPAE